MTREAMEAEVASLLLEQRRLSSFNLKLSPDKLLLLSRLLQRLGFTRSIPMSRRDAVKRYSEAQDENSFHATLDANPDDHTTRQVFADWLEERGDPRAAGYRALGILRKSPYHALDYDASKFVHWWAKDDNRYPISSLARGDPNNHSVVGVAHGLPRGWFEAVHGKGLDGPAWIAHPTRRESENAAALAFGQLPPERQHEILNPPSTSTTKLSRSTSVPRPTTSPTSNPTHVTTPSSTTPTVVSGGGAYLARRADVRRYAKKVKPPTPGEQALGRPHSMFPGGTPTDLITHAGNALDNPMDDTAIRAFADHLLETHPNDPHAQKFVEWVNGGWWSGSDWKDAMYHPRGGWVNQGENVPGSAYLHLHPQRVVTPGEKRQQEDLEQPYGVLSKFLDSPQWVFTRPGTRQVTLPVSGMTATGIVTTRGAPKLTSPEVAQHLYDVDGVRGLALAVIGARYFHPDAPHNQPEGEAVTRPKFTRRRDVVVKYAKADTRHTAHPLIKGFPLEFALRSLANDPKSSDTLRSTAKHVLTTGDTSGLWGLHDLVQQHENADGTTGHPILKAGYNLMSAADKLHLDRHTYDALTEMGNEARRRGAYADSSQPQWAYSPEHAALRAGQGYENGTGPYNEMYKGELNDLRQRVKKLAPNEPDDHIEESIKRHVYRGNAAYAATMSSSNVEDEQRRSLQPHGSPRHGNTRFTFQPTEVQKETEKATRYFRHVLYERRLKRYAEGKPRGGSWWMKPSGEVIPVDDHYLWLNRNGYDGDGPKAFDKAFSEGLQRVLLFGNDVVSENPQHPPTTAQRTSLKDLAITHKKSQVKHLHGGNNEFRVLWSNPDVQYTRRHVVKRYALTVGKGESLMGGEDFMHEVHDEQGKRVGHVWVTPMDGGTRLHINHVGAMGHEANSLGPAVMRHALRQLKAHYPNAKTITGTRVTGAVKANTGEERPTTVRMGRSTTTVVTPAPTPTIRSHSFPKKYAKPNRSGFMDALHRMQSSNHTALTDSARDVARRMGVQDSHVLPALHDSPSGSVPGVAQAIYGPMKPEKVHELASWVNGLLPNGPGYSVFHARPTGPDTLYRIRHNGSGMDARVKLDRAGIKERVLIPHRKGFDILIPDKGNKLAQNVTNYAQANGLNVEASPGHFATVGSNDQSQSRDTFRGKVVQGEKTQMTRKRYSRPDRESGFLTRDQNAIFNAAVISQDPIDWRVLGDHLQDNGFPNTGEVLSRVAANESNTRRSSTATSPKSEFRHREFRHSVSSDGSRTVAIRDGKKMLYFHLDVPKQMKRTLTPRRYALDLNDTIRTGLEASRRQQRGQGYVQDTTAGKVLGDALDEAGEPHAPFYRNLAHSSQFTNHETEQGPVKEFLNEPHPLRTIVRSPEANWLFRPGSNNSTVVYRLQNPHDSNSRSHTAVLHAPALREWAAHPKVSPSLKAHLLNAADHLESQEPPTQLSRVNRYAEAGTTTEVKDEFRVPVIHEHLMGHRQIYHYVPQRVNYGPWHWNFAGSTGDIYKTDEEAKQDYPHAVTYDELVKGRKLTGGDTGKPLLHPQEVHLITGGKEGEAPDQVDWRPQETIPEDFYAMSRRRGVRKYAEKTPHSAENGRLTPDQLKIAEQAQQSGDPVDWRVLGDHLQENGFPNAGEVISRAAESDGSDWDSNHAHNAYANYGHGDFNHYEGSGNTAGQRFVTLRLGNSIFRFRHRVAQPRQLSRRRTLTCR